MRQRENYYFYRCYNIPAPAPDAQPIAMVEFRAGGGGDGQPEVIFFKDFFHLLNNLGGLRFFNFLFIELCFVKLYCSISPSISLDNNSTISPINLGRKEIILRKA